MKSFFPVAIVLFVLAVSGADLLWPALPAAEDLVGAELERLEQENWQLRQALQAILQVSDLVPIAEVDESIVVDLRYASANNFTGRRVYPANVALLRRETALKLAAANAEFRRDGYRIKVWDAYRPYHIHQQLWEAAGDNRHFFAHPYYGSIHNRGAAVDITLVDSEGREVEMPTDFDDFSHRAARNWAGMSEEARKNLDYMTEVMVRHGFAYLDFEWWHFVDNEWWRYPILDLPLELFAEDREGLPQ